MPRIDTILKKILMSSSDMKKYKMRFTIKDSVINFVEGPNYTDNFGDQWTRYPKLQLDSFNGTTISEDRFWRALALNPDDLKGKLVLDVGCGTGRFSEIAVKAGAIVIGLDYSSAAYVAAKNLKSYSNFQAIRGDIYNLPFKKNCFDLVYCLGVLQHTPDVERAFKSLPPIIKNNGLLVVDYYWKRFQTVFGWKYIIRLITAKLNEKTVFKILKIIHPIFYPISEFLSKIPIFGKAITRLLPVVNYCNDYKQLDKKTLREWSFLDTYDNYAPKYDKPQTVKTVIKWANEVGLKNINCEHVGHLVVRGRVNIDSK